MNARQLPVTPREKEILDSYKSRLLSILEELKSREVNVDARLIMKAYEFAADAHKEQQRLSGEPYISHPVEVVRILATYSIPDSETLAAALMHDILEDCPQIYPEQILSYFGETVYMLVHGVTKLKRSLFSSALLGETASLRKFFLESLNDLRILQIRMADRLHNLQTIEHIRDPEKRRATAQEALDFYAPLGEMFGFYRLKTELETEAFRVLDPATYRYIVSRVEAESKRQKRRLAKLVRQLEAALREQFPLGNFQVRARIKTPYSIYRKMKQQNLNFEQVQDIFGLRVLVQNDIDCYIALSVVHRLWRYHSYFRDFIGNPKTNGYRSLHTLVKPSEDSQTIEVQIRTFDMDRTAEYGAAAHYLYKTQNHFDLFRKELPVLHELLSSEDLAANPRQFMEVLRRQFLEQDIFVYTPKGDTILLPRGSTPLDFAFKIHTEVGLHYAGAKVNGRPVDMDYVIQVGDRVEILTDQNVEPSPFWLNYAKTPLALKKIGEFLRKQKRADSLRQAKWVLERQIIARGYHDLDLLRPSLLKEFARRSHLKDAEAVYQSLLTGHLSPEKVVEDLFRLHHEETKKMLDQTLVPPAQESRGTTNITLGQIHLQASPYPESTPAVLAKCCTPVYGDEVVTIPRGNQVEVHREDCSQVAAHPEWDVRPAVWEPVPPPNFLFETTIFVIAPNRRGLLKEVISVISDLNINILSNSIRPFRKDLGYLVFIVEVRSVTEVKAVLKALREKVPDLYRVDRQSAL